MEILNQYISHNHIIIQIKNNCKDIKEFFLLNIKIGQIINSNNKNIMNSSEIDLKCVLKKSLYWMTIVSAMQRLETQNQTKKLLR